MFTNTEIALSAFREVNQHHSVNVDSHSMVRIRILNTTSDIKIGNVPQELLVYKEEILK